MPSPTIGRRVWVWNAWEGDFVDKDQPFDAGIVYVWNDGLISADVCDHVGNRFVIPSLSLREPRQDDHHGMPGGSVATWMPIQMK